jgi:hypothetical protein
VGQDCILRAGFQPALVGLFTSDSGGLPTRRTQRVPLQTCPTVLAGFQVPGKVCGIGRFRATYKPYNSSGEMYLHNYIGMIGIPMDMYPEFPDARDKIWKHLNAVFEVLQAPRTYNAYRFE